MYYSVPYSPGSSMCIICIRTKEYKPNFLFYYNNIPLSPSIFGKTYTYYVTFSKIGLLLNHVMITLVGYMYYNTIAPYLYLHYKLLLLSLSQRRLVDRRKLLKRPKKSASTRRRDPCWMRTELRRMPTISIACSSLPPTTPPSGRSTWPSFFTPLKWTKPGTSHRGL